MEINSKYIRYSQCVIVDEIDDPLPLEVMNIYGDTYVSLDNRRLYARKNMSTKCIVYYLDDPVPSHMQDHEMNKLTLLWCTQLNGKQLHRLTLEANTMQGVIIIRCASQNPTFSKNGEDESPYLSASLTRTHESKKVIDEQFVKSDDYSSFMTADQIFIRPIQGINKYHERTDLQHVVMTRSDLFSFVKYEQCMSDLGSLSFSDELCAQEREIQKEENYLFDSKSRL